MVEPIYEMLLVATDSDDEATLGLELPVLAKPSLPNVITPICQELSSERVELHLGVNARLLLVVGRRLDGLVVLVPRKPLRLSHDLV